MWDTNNMLVHLGMLVAELVLVVRISVRVVQKCTGYLEKKCVWIFGGFGWLGTFGFSWEDVGEDCFGGGC